MRENGSIDITIYNLMHSLMQKLSSILPITSFKLKLETLSYIPRATQKKSISNLVKPTQATLKIQSCLKILRITFTVV